MEFFNLVLDLKLEGARRKADIVAFMRVLKAVKLPVPMDVGNGRGLCETARDATP